MVAACKLRFSRSLQVRAQQPLAAIIVKMFEGLRKEGHIKGKQQRQPQEGGSRMKKEKTAGEERGTAGKSEVSK